MAVIPIKSTVQFDSNIFLVTGDRNVLIDAGTGYGSREVVAGIRRALDGRKLDAVILTHFHIDHIGGLGDIVSEFGCPAFAGPDADVISSAGTDALAREFGIDLKPVKTEKMEEGRIIDLGAHRLRVIYTPGHTSGGICLYDEVTHSLFAGDTVFNPGVGRTDLPTGSMRKLVDSLVKLSKLNIKSLYPGHGISTDDGNRAVLSGLRMTEGYHDED